MSQILHEKKKTNFAENVIRFLWKIILYNIKTSVEQCVVFDDNDSMAKDCCNIIITAKTEGFIVLNTLHVPFYTALKKQHSYAKTDLE